MNILIVDLNNLLARNTHAFPKARTPQGFPVGGLYGTLNQLRLFLARNPHDAVVCAADWGVPAWRKEICPEYKAQREEKRTPEEDALYKAYKEQVPVAYKVLQPAGVSTVRAKNWEGDDVIAALCLHRLAKHQCTILSSDRDFVQLVDGKRIAMYDVHHDMLREPDPHFCLKRCLDPKDSDNLDGVSGIGPVKADGLIAEWTAGCKDLPGSVTYLDNFLGWCKAQPQTRLNSKKETVATTYGAIVAEQQKVRANWKCTYLPGSAAACAKELKWRHGEKDFVNFKTACKEFSLRPILEDITAVWPPYNALKRVKGA